MLFRKIFLSALVIGFLCGLGVSVLQSFTTTPIILEAEKYEVEEEMAPPSHSHVHHKQEVVKEIGHHHDEEAWTPVDGFERTLYTTIANMLNAVGFSLILLSAMSLKRDVDAKKGVLWGIAGFFVFFAAPSFGLQPEIPGMQAAVLEGRQGWWLTTVIFSAIGLSILVFVQGTVRITGVLVLLVPHIIGAPQPEVHGFYNTDTEAVKVLTELSKDFIVASAVTMFLFWVSLGCLAGYVYKRFLNKIEV